jgi:hypothetical protein
LALFFRTTSVFGPAEGEIGFVLQIPLSLNPPFARRAVFSFQAPYLGGSAYLHGMCSPASSFYFPDVDLSFIYYHT